MRFIWEIMHKDKYRYLLGCILGVISLPVVLFKSTIGGQLVDEVVLNQNIKQLAPLITALLILVIFRAVTKRISTMILEDVSQTTVMKLRQKMYFRLSKMDFNYFDKTRTGSIMTKLTADVDMIRYFIAYAGYTLIEQLLVFFGGIGIMFFISWQLTLMLLAISPFVLLAMVKMAAIVRPTFEKIRQKNSNLNTTVQENISGNRVVKAFAKENFETLKFNQKNEDFRNANIESAYIASRFLPWFDVMASALAVITVIGGGYFVLCGMITVGELFVINSLLWTISGPVRMFAWLINDVQRTNASVAKIQEILYLHPKIKTKKRILYKDAFKGDVEFQNVSFKYENEDALHDVSFSVKAGQTVAIIGATGAGKSSLVNLICRFYDVSSGSVIIDGIDVRNVNIRKLRQSISMAMQDVFLFSDTIEGNIAYGAPDVSFDEVVKVAKIADAHDFIMRFEEGYDTIVGERGVGLSGGQKQRIALARALLKKPSILILDDTTSSVDMETEHHIHQTLRSYFSGKTTFLIAHRISTVKDADLILVLDQGRLVEQGTHQELLEKQGYYYDVYRNQLGDFNQGGDKNGKK